MVDEELIKRRMKTLMPKLGIKFKDLLSHRRTRRLVDARSMIAARLKKMPGVRQQDIADLYGISQAAVSKLLVRHQDLMAADVHYRDCYEAL